MATAHDLADRHGREAAAIKIIATRGNIWLSCESPAFPGLNDVPVIQERGWT